MNCRLCLIACSNENASPIFSHESEYNLSFLIDKYFFIQISENDFSTSICKNCSHHLQDFHEYCEYIIHCQQNLPTLLKEMLPTKTFAIEVEDIKCEFISEDEDDMEPDQVINQAIFNETQTIGFTYETTPDITCNSKDVCLQNTEGIKFERNEYKGINEKTQGFQLNSEDLNYERTEKGSNCNKRFINNEFLKPHILHHVCRCGKKYDTRKAFQNHLKQQPDCKKRRKKSKKVLHVPKLDHNISPGILRRKIVEYARNGEDWKALAKSFGIMYKTAYYWVRYAKSRCLKKKKIKMSEKK